MGKKTLIQISLLIFLILVSYYVIQKYFFKKNTDLQIIKENTNNLNIENDIKDKQDLIKNIKYTSNNAVGDIYELIADFGQSNLENPNLMFLTNVKGKVIFKNDNKPRIILTSKFADFNTVSFETTFKENVKITRQDEVITGDKLYLVLDNEEQDSDDLSKTPKEENLIRMSNNIFFKKPGYTLKADVLEIDLTTKNTKIFMNNKLKKVMITSVIK